MKDQLDKLTMDWIYLLKQKNNNKIIDRDTVMVYNNHHDSVTVIKMKKKSIKTSFASKNNYEWLKDYLNKKLILISWWDAPWDTRRSAEKELNNIEDYKNNYPITKKIKLLDEWCNKWLEVGSKTRIKTLNAIMQHEKRAIAREKGDSKISVALEQDAHSILVEIGKLSNGMTMSDVIIKHLEPVLEEKRKKLKK